MKKTLLALCAVCSLQAPAQNPYLPLWEYIPDGEPYVFEDPDKPGHQRVYIYGSHDSLIDMYCGREQVVWSAPVEDLNAWRYDGIIFKSERGSDGRYLNADGKADVLYAPDVTEVTEKDGTKTYYLFPNNQTGGRNGMVAKAKRPDGPFEVCNWSLDDPTKVDGLWGFDPACFVDDDGRVYGYWGFGTPYAAELDPKTMATVKPGTDIVEYVVTGLDKEGPFNFYEASSMRKIGDKYVFIFSRRTRPGEFGLGESNYTLAYGYGDNPLGPFTYGGTIIDGRARGVDENGKTIFTAYPNGNTHGSLCNINGKWWLFYHRQCGLTEYSRQPMVSPVEVKVQPGKGGKVTISEAEFNSEGFSVEGLNPTFKTPAGLACYFVGPEGAREEWPNFIFSGSYIKNTYFDPNSYEGPFNQKIPFCPVVNNTDGSTVGYKYFNFSQLAGRRNVDFYCHVVPEGVDAEVDIVVGSPYISKGGKLIGSFKLDKAMPQKMTEISVPVSIPAKMTGKQPLFFIFRSPEHGKSTCQFHDFHFLPH